MSIILNTLLIAAFGVAAAVALLSFLLREPLRRLRRYLRDWAEQDQRRAEDAERDAALRERAEAELHRELHGPDDQYDLNDLAGPRFDGKGKDKGGSR